MIGCFKKKDNKWFVSYYDCDCCPNFVLNGENSYCQECINNTKLITLHKDNALFACEGNQIDFEIVNGYFVENVNGVEFIDKVAKIKSKKEPLVKFGNIFSSTEIIPIKENKADFLYSEIEDAIIMWEINGTQTAGILTRKIIELINKKLK